MPRTPEEMAAAIAKNLPAKTGRTLEEWVALARASGMPAHMQRVEWLKREHGLGHSTASLIARLSLQSEDYVPPTVDETLEAQYADARAGLRPTYDRLAEFITALGPDVVVEPRRTYMAFRRRVQFAVVQASTKSRVDLGLALHGVEPAGRLQPAGSLGSERITHRVALASPEDADDEVIGWLRAAYVAGA